MRFTTILASALTATAVIAAPLDKRAITTSWKVEVVTEYTTVYGPIATPSPIGALQQSSSPAPVTTSSTPPPPAPTTTPVQVPVQKPTVAPAPAPSPSQPASGSSGPANYGQCTDFVKGSTPDFNTPPVSCGISIIDTINKWRAFYDKPALTWSSAMAQAAWATVTHNQGGVTEVHPGLVDGSMGETISPGFYVPGPGMSLQGDTPFEVAIVNWLCEVPSDHQLQASGPTGVDQCNISRNQASIEEQAGETGHHDIFLGDYTHIGCEFVNNAHGNGGWAQFEGQWACDFN